MIDLLRMLQAVFGIGLVIFVHEAGHFLAARWCGVRVQIFSLGFGPKLFGVVRGGTLYQVAAIPVGGFVAMAGDQPDGSGRPPAPDDLRAKSVGQRFLIYSGGVLMNMALALVVFPILFWQGVSFVKPVVSSPSPGGPAWSAGVVPGSEILAVNGADVFDAFHVLTEVAVSGGDEVELLVREPNGGPERLFRIESEYDEANGIRRLDLGRPALDPQRRIDVAPDSPAWRAGMRSGDSLLGVGDLPEEMRLVEQLDVALERGTVLELSVQSPDGEQRRVTIEPDLLEGSTRPRLGIIPARAEIVGLRPDGPLDGLDLREGDRLLAVGSRGILRTKDLELALIDAVPGATLVVDRPIDSEGSTYSRIELPLPDLTREQIFRVERHLALGLDRDGLLLAVTPGEGAWIGGLRDGDRLRAIDGVAMADWTEVFEVVGAAARAGRELELTVDRRASTPEAAWEPLVLRASAIPQPEPELGSRFNEYGFAWRTWDHVVRADGPLDAIRVGFQTSWLYVEQTWLTLKGMLLARVSTRNMGGPVAIGQISYTFAERGWSKLMYFLCMLSVNLALINILPVPVLDGGHLLFLLVEKVKGSPVSERVVGYSQLIGVVFIVGLMVYVTFNDIRRAFGL